MLILTIVSVVLSAIGQILVKLGAENLDLSFKGSKVFYSLLLILRNVPIMSGVIIYGLSFLLWIKVLSKVPLSYAYPMVSLGYILIMIFSYFLFHENISLTRLVGILLIIAGVVFVARS
ncbi:putative 4-amino-4-deoxy-L-arabinose-phosphoundecaprenol flippase subunit ArnF [Peptococcaceae bacterium CEB3]|nr:putative 4-amino-4-deoxy-L-arabinose-phosphoundecaprenol flippase subunit ArnF [Peptococcaceae bacterium CEB3]